MLKKIQADILARQKASTKEQAAQAALAKKKAEIESMFDLDRINLQAALSRKLSAEDEVRVKILQKLRDGTKEAVDEAQKYADVLQVIADGKISSAEVEMLAKKWGMTTTGVTLYLQELFAANEELKKMLALLSQVKLPTVTPVTQATTNEQVLNNLKKATDTILKLQEKVNATNKIPDDYIREMPAVIDPVTGELTGRGRRNIPEFIAMADGGIVTRPTQALIGEAGAEAVIPLDRMGSMGTRVTVNVAGSVISEGQLQSVIQDVLYNLNRTGAVTQLSNLGR